MGKQMLVLGMIGITVGLVAGCRDRQAQKPESGEGMQEQASEAVTPEEVGKESAEAVDAAMKLADQTKDEYVAKLKSQVDDLEQRLETLRGKSKELGEEASEKWDDQIAKLENQKQELQDSVSDVADASGDAWRELARGTSKAGKDLAEALKKAEAELTGKPEESSDMTPASGEEG